jgi:hypothetical protein
METTTTIRWETLKDKCKTEFLRKFRNMTDPEMIAALHMEVLDKLHAGTFKGTFKLLKEVEGNCLQTIDRCDIRGYKALCKLFPEAFPTWVRAGRCSAEYDEEAEWIFVKN